jgi:hypothetical protein
MANACDYKVIVKGKKNACYAFFGSMSAYDYKDITSESGTDDKFVLFFEGDCKWSVDSYCTPWEGGFPVELPDDPDEAMREAEDKYWYNTVQERSKMFGVEVQCNSADVEGCGDMLAFAEEYSIEVDKKNIGYYEHYKNGEDVGGKCPKKLYIPLPEWYDDDED